MVKSTKPAQYVARSAPTVPRTGTRAAGWNQATWEGATREQLRRWSRLSLEEIVAAQEEMAELSLQLSPAPGKEPPDDQA